MLSRTKLSTIVIVFLIGLLNVVTAQVQTQPKPVLISTNNQPNEVSIAIDPTQPGILLAASNLNQVYVSYNGGESWEEKIISSTYGVYGDPCVMIDEKGVFYYFHLAKPLNGNWLDRIVCQRSFDKGKSWDNGTFTGLNGTKVQDKHWVANYSNPENNQHYIFLTWTEFDKYGSRNPADSSRIMFSYSLNQGETWSKAQRINQFSGDCVDSSLTVEGAVPAVDRLGNLYVAWAGPKGIVMNKTQYPELKWPKQNKLIHPFLGGWSFDVDSLYRCNGLPVTATDISTSPFSNSIYVTWAERLPDNQQADVYLSCSRDFGESFSAPLKINADQTKNDKFMPWITVNKLTGRLYCLYYDRSYESDNIKTDVTLSWSDDGGQTFKHKKVNEKSFSPNKDVFFGDYLALSQNENYLHLCWTELHGKDLKVYTLRIVDSEL
jgi:hypothetical protein